MRFIGYIVIIVLLIGLSFGLLSFLGVGWVIPGIPLLLVICIAMEYGSFDYVFFALLGGVWLDMLYGLPLGSFTVPYLAAGTVSYILFQRWLWIEASWKYYIGFAFISQVFLLVWLWAYTGALYRFHWVTVSVSGRQLWRHSWKIIVIYLVFAIPVYLIVNLLVKWWKSLNRQPLQLS